jgi:hypothetical protein
VSDSCYVWRFLQTFDFSDRGIFNVNLKTERSVCTQEGTFHSDEDSLVWVSFLAIFLSSISFVGTGIYFYGMAGYLKKLQLAYDRRIQESKDLSNEDPKAEENY